MESAEVKKYTEFEKILKNLETRQMQFSAKCYEKVKFYKNFCKQRLLLWMTTLALKVQFLIFKGGEYDWRCSNYPFCHAKTLHCAERKAFAYETWTRCFFIKL